jgi:hypothetical protein
LAIIAFENEPNWQKKLREFCNIAPLPESIESAIAERNSQKERIKKVCETPEYHELANVGKSNRKTKLNSATNGKDDYKPRAKNKQKANNEESTSTHHNLYFHEILSL